MIFWGLISGVLVSFYFILGGGVFLLLGVVLLVMVLSLISDFKSLVFVVLLFLVGFLRVYFFFGVVDEVPNQEVYRACVVREVDKRIFDVKYTVKVEDVAGLVLLSTSRYPLYKYGDCFSFRGKLAIPDVIDKFDYRGFLRRYGIYYVVYRAQIFDVVEGGSSVYGFLLDFKEGFEDRINLLFLEPDSSFLAGLLLGSRRGIDAVLLDDFQRTGITHVIAISGYNITLLVVIVFSLFGFLKKKLRILISAVVILLFVILVGMAAAVVRAGIMGFITLLALWNFRQQDVFLSLIVTCCVMTLWNPYVFISDVGFQMSFLSTVGVIYCSPFLMRIFSFLPNVFAIRESFSLTVAAQLMVLPIMLWSFDGVSLVAPVVNVLVLPLIPLAMFLGFCAVVVSFLFFPLGNLLAVFAHIVLKFVVIVVEWFAALPFAYHLFD